MLYDTASPAQTLEQDVLGVINAPLLALDGHPLIGTGAIGNGFAFAQQEIEHTPTTLATGFTQVETSSPPTSSHHRPSRRFRPR